MFGENWNYYRVTSYWNLLCPHAKQANVVTTISSLEPTRRYQIKQDDQQLSKLQLTCIRAHFHKDGGEPLQRLRYNLQSHQNSVNGFLLPWKRKYDALELRKSKCDYEQGMF